MDGLKHWFIKIANKHTERPSSHESTGTKTSCSCMSHKYPRSWRQEKLNARIGFYLCSLYRTSAEIAPGMSDTWTTFCESTCHSYTNWPEAVMPIKGHARSLHEDDKLWWNLVTATSSAHSCIEIWSCMFFPSSKNSKKYVRNMQVSLLMAKRVRNISDTIVFLEIKGRVPIVLRENQ